VTTRNSQTQGLEHGADVSQWHQPWLNTVLSEMVSLLRAKAARARMRASNDSLSWRLRQLRGRFPAD